MAATGARQLHRSIKERPKSENPKSETNPNSECREAIENPIFSDDFAINDFAFIGSDRGKQRDGKIIDGKMMMSFEIASRISARFERLLLSDLGFRRASDLSQRFTAAAYNPARADRRL